MGGPASDTERAKAELERVLELARQHKVDEAAKQKVLDEAARKVALPAGSTRKRRHLKKLSEVEQRLVKMERNRQSAQRSRERKRQIIQELEKQNAELLAELRRVCA